MDSYPEDLAPEFEESGAVLTPFDEWWLKTEHAFPNVPNEVAEQWLHRHWKHSPFSYLPSRKYEFTLEEFEPEKLIEFRSGFVDWSYKKAVAQGEHIWRKCANIWICREFAKSENFPLPIVVLDNTDNHLAELPEKPEWHEIPKGLVVVEGHRRHAIACYRYSTGHLRKPFSAWVMKYLC